jgi:ankyrin repeat protein
MAIRGLTPLHFAAWKDYEDVVKMLLNKGANLSAKDQRGRTPLSMAEKAEHTKIVELLHKHGAKE